MHISLVVLAIGFGCRAYSLPFRSWTSFTDIVVFGDSLSDNGNTYHYTNCTWPADPAYYYGRFSNGPVWVEDIANRLNANLQDYAIGGATSDNKLVQGYTGLYGDIPVPSSVDQISQYLEGAQGKGDVGHALFVILVGANDAFFDTNITGAQSAAVVAASVKRLSEGGARHFLVGSFPDLARIPYHAYVSPSTNAQLHAYSIELRTSIRALSGPNIAYVDLYQLMDDFFANPESYGFDSSVMTKSCLTGAYSEAPKTLCDDPDQYIFWDEYHPTKKTHSLMATYAENVIKNNL